MAKAQQQNGQQKKSKRSPNLNHDPKLNWDQVNEIRRSYVRRSSTYGTTGLAILWPEHFAPMGDFLIHTTRYPVAILNSNRIVRPKVGQKYVSLTRSPFFAEYWADNNRPDDEGMAAHLILDRSKLRHKYKIEPFHDPWNSSDNLTGRHRYEAEERIARDIFPLFDVLYGVVVQGAQ